MFSNANPLAGRNDSETPNGFFAKDNDANIGVGGNKQMALYGDMKKPLRVLVRSVSLYSVPHNAICGSLCKELHRLRCTFKIIKNII